MIGKALILLAVAELLTACETAPVTGRQQLNMISEPQEIQLGMQAFQDVLKKERVSDNPQYNAMVQRVGRRIAEASGRTDYQWDFKVLDDAKQINAFALPGGKVAVYTGLFQVVSNDAELAAVIGHEVAHATAHHGAERASQQMGAQIVLDLASAVVGARSPQNAQLISQALGAGATYGVLMPWSRKQESEADRIGLVYMAKAGYDPHAARDLWVKMSKAAQGRAKPPEFLSTHPADETRIRQIEAWLPEAMASYRPR